MTTTHTVTLNKQVQLIRYHSMEIRRLRARIVSGQVRNTATQSALQRHEQARKQSSRELHEAGLANLVRLLVEEANLRHRIHDAGFRDRMDIQHRLDSVLQDIREQTRSVGNLSLDEAVEALRTSRVSS